MANWTHRHYRKPTLHKKGGSIKGHHHRNYRIKEKVYKNKGFDLIDLFEFILFIKRIFKKDE